MASPPPEEVERLVDEAVEVFGSIAVLVNNAGVETAEAFVDLPAADWDRVLDDPERVGRWTGACHWAGWEPRRT